MRPSIIVTDLPVKLSPELLNLLWLHMAGKQTTIQQAHAVTLNFKDPSYLHIPTHGDRSITFMPITQ